MDRRNGYPAHDAKIVILRDSPDEFKRPQWRNCETPNLTSPFPSRHPICTVCRPFSRYHRGVYTQTERWLMDWGNKAAGVTSITSLERNFPRSGNNSKYRGIGPYPGFSGLLRSG
ncbi:unnamed protein product [Lasius platythorax]|uniref:Uncharacterized protein n=1 Tax=Lasius platythorax TaxID=488582 RepID=A0AAV2N9M2_9HYME